MIPVDLTGQIFHRWTVIAPAKNGSYRKSRWLCRCSCGQERIVTSYDLKRSHSRSCGCLQREIARASNYKHGGCRNHGRSAEFNRWEKMLERCYNPKCRDFKNWGARGIRVCAQWRESFESYRDYIMKIGFTNTKRQSIDRIDNDGHYEPGNMRVADDQCQARNKRNNRFLTAFGKTQLLVEWAETTGFSTDRIRQRVSAGWSAERALTQTVRTYTR